MTEDFTLDKQWQYLKQSRENIQFFSPLFEHYYPRIYRYIYVRIRHQATAEDLTGAVFLKITEYLPRKKWNSMTGFIKYLYMTAGSTLKNYYRDHRPTAELVTEVAAEKSAEHQLDLTQALEKLKSAERELVYYYYFLGYSFEEISQLTGKKGSAIRMRHQRLMRKLEKLL